MHNLNASKYFKKTGHHRLTRETQFEWRFAGGLMMRPDVIIILSLYTHIKGVKASMFGLYV